MEGRNGISQALDASEKTLNSLKEEIASSEEKIKNIDAKANELSKKEAGLTARRKELEDYIAVTRSQIKAKMESIAGSRKTLLEK